MNETIQALSEKIGYQFIDSDTIQSALTHRSFRYETPSIETDNQRLEFLGDAVLGLVSAEYLYERFPHLREGDLTRSRSRITSRSALAKIGLEIDVGTHLLLGKGEQNSGGDERKSNIADAVEAILGAAYLDGGLKAVRQIFDRLFIPYFESTTKNTPVDNPKGTLQEIAQKKWKISPRYTTINEHGPAHSKTFVVEVHINDKLFGSGKGANKRSAEMKAASEALKLFEDEDKADPQGQEESSEA